MNLSQKVKIYFSLLPEKRPIVLVWSLLLFSEIFLVRDAAWLSEHFYGKRFLVNFTLTAFGLLAVLSLIRHSLRTKQMKLVCYMFVAIPIVLQASYFDIYREFIRPFGFDFFNQNPLLTLQFYFDTFPWFRILTLVAILAFSFVVLAETAPPVKRLYTYLNSVFALSVLLLVTFAWYSFYDFQTSVFAYYGSLSEFLARKTNTYKVQRPSILPSMGYPKADSIVWIIGESAVLDHMSLYGYSKETTPFLLKKKREGALVAFENAISAGTKTLLSVPYMLFGLEGPDPSGRIYTQPSIFNYAKARGFTTALISAQDYRWYDLEKLIVDKEVDVFLPGPTFFPDVTVSKGADDFVVLEKGVIPFLDKVKGPFLLVTQMDGSHYPYSSHSPQEFKKFLPEHDPNSINAYDNTLVYSDMYFERLEKEVRSRFPNSWIFYTSDHGQNLEKENGRFSSGYSDQMIRNPLFIFPPKDYLKVLEGQIHSPVTQVDIFSTILELLDIEPTRPVDSLSLLSKIPSSRLRVCSEYMPTFSNNPTAVIVLPDGSKIQVDFDKRRAFTGDGKEPIAYEELPLEYRELLNSKLEGLTRVKKN